ncbi:MAG: cation-translocating P-type ATPase, partial [Campylobacterota bacterium]|nr:cation-translocating P-type ATPase [Campylobacterota bacterium]
VIEGIHCAACVWLNEKALHKMDGVIDVHINHTNNKAYIQWADDVVKLSQIVDMIRAIGYNAFPYDPSLQEQRTSKQRKDFYLRMAVATFATMNIMWVAVAQYAGYFTGITQDIKTVLNYAEWFLSTPVLFYSGWIFFKGAYFGIKNRIVNMDILVATGATLTYFYSIYITLIQSGEAYFDSVSMIITFVLFGKFLEVLSKKSAADTLDSISKHIPNEITIIKDSALHVVKPTDVKVGDIVLVKAGERAVIDGTVVEGEGSFDESSISGESEPIFKRVGDSIISGTTSIETTLSYEAIKDFEHSTLSNLVSLLESAMHKKPKIEQLANSLSEYFSSIILFLSLGTFIVWYFMLSGGFETSFMIAISVIIIACPCALALATPVATLVGLGIGAKRNILFKEAAQLETMAKATMLVVDKTGTLTYGKPDVVKANISENFDVSLIYSLTQSSKHPISKGVSRYLEDSYDELCSYELSSLTSVSARGVKANYNSKTILGGSEQFLKESGVEVESIKEYSSFYVAVDGECVASFELEDTIKKNALELIETIKAQGLKVIMLTGDHESIASSVAKKLGIDSYYSQLLPEHKAQYIASYKKAGEVVVMVGDGVNDTLALSGADIAISMGNGSDIAIEVSDVVLLNDSLSSLLEAFQISKKTFRLIKQNLLLSLVYNAITIPLAMVGYIIPLIAAISMSASSLLVVSNSLRIKFGLMGFKKDNKNG